MPERLQALLGSLTAIGKARLATFATVAVLTTALIMGGVIFLAQPTYETLYVGLDRDDVNRIGIVLSEAGIGYDIDSAGSTVLVEAGQTARARMILAEKGLPGSNSSGYELFDNLGSLGLTSFMQEVTRVRALEGEIARSVQSIDGVKAARVHIVMPDQTGFRDRNRRPTASVLLSSNGSDLTVKAEGIRKLVAAAIPSLNEADVTVLDASGRLLASGDAGDTETVGAAFDLKNRIERDLSRTIGNALRPYIGELNYRVAVQADIDTDRRQIEETIFDPDSKVERSVQISRSEDRANEAKNSNSAGVEQNIPTEGGEGSSESGAKSSEERERREETTNFEISSKRIATLTNGYRIRRLNVAVLLNREILERAASTANVPLEDRLDTIRTLISTAAGIESERGDRIDVTAIEFLPADESLEPIVSGWMEAASPHLSTAIRALVFVIVSILVLLLGVRPLLNSLELRPSKSKDAPALNAGNNADVSLLPDLNSAGEEDAFAQFDEPGEFSSDFSGSSGDFSPNSSFSPSSGFQMDETPEMLAEIELRQRMADVGEDPRARVMAMLEIDRDRTLQLLRRWIRDDMKAVQKSKAA
ncbi:flagellar basal-body MS-ring/collar protein FliF [Notoacmeibacter ruber]|uniref:flagellar basal-body MS-ring/collar protein FliF n=1 Tax=Notoacmeibacter ruber TaxID=2670375 RepID=UPI001313DB8C|nr:flagellar basal-body MS-ring/collar protein FliF [Notoacmeibacter ruber]